MKESCKIIPLLQGQCCCAIVTKSGNPPKETTDLFEFVINQESQIIPAFVLFPRQRDLVKHSEYLPSEFIDVNKIIN